MIKVWSVRRTVKSLTLAAIAVAVILTCAFFARRDKSVATGGEITNWGLSFQKEGKTPVGNRSAEDLEKFGAYYAGSSEEKKIYLTFDCGFENGNTQPILDALKKHNAPAAFFVVGHFLETAPELVKQMEADGHIVGNHTYNHPDMSKIASSEEFAKEISSVETKYEEVTGKKMAKFYRPPQGKFSEQNLQMASDLGYKTMFWSLAYVDWYNDKQPTRDEAFAKLIPRIHPGAIVLLHSTSKTNGEILDDLLMKYEEAGYEFCSIADFA